jgi:hypothetical protein
MHDFVNPKTHAIEEKPILKMIHRYNLADLNLANRTAVEPIDKTFKIRSEIKTTNDWATSYNKAYGENKIDDATSTTFKFKQTQNT